MSHSDGNLDGTHRVVVVKYALSNGLVEREVRSTVSGGLLVGDRWVLAKDVMSSMPEAVERAQVMARKRAESIEVQLAQVRALAELTDWSPERVRKVKALAKKLVLAERKEKLKKAAEKG